MVQKAPESAQIIFMNRIKEALPANVSFADELSNLLEVSLDGAYRRIRGQTGLSIEHIGLICNHFKISFDSFISNTDQRYVSFSYHQLSTHGSSFRQYLESIKNDLDQILKFPENIRQIIFAAEDIPIFQNFAHPFLTAFKIFYWNKSILNAKGYEDKKFEIEHIDNDLLETAAEIYERYSKIASIEIWSDDTVNSTLKQIEFYWDSGVFINKKEALKVCEEVGLMLTRINKQAELNVKVDSDGKPASSHKNYTLYHSDVMIGTNCVMATIGDRKSAYISYHSFNVMETTNANFCNETDLWLKNLIRKSNLISGVAEKQRYLYFKHVDEALKKLINKIEND